MIDDRTEKIMSNIMDNWRSANSDERLKWNYNKFRDWDLIEFDSYRLFRFFLELKNKSAPSQYYDNLFQENTTKLFVLSKPLQNMLDNMKPITIKEEIKMPFEHLFIDYNYNDDENGFSLVGLMLSIYYEEEFKEMNETAKKVNADNLIKFTETNSVIITSYCFVKEINDWLIYDINLNLKNGKIIPRGNMEAITQIQSENLDIYKKLKSKVEKRIRSVILNLLLFLNEPRVSVYIQSSNNQRREKKGLIPIPSQLRTKIDVGLESFINKIYFDGSSHSKLGYAFWVRGHWMKFVSPRYVNKQGQKVWVKPHIKGEGLMPPQVFEVNLKK